jgi:hypothetical protein
MVSNIRSDAATLGGRSGRGNWAQIWPLMTSCIPTNHSGGNKFVRIVPCNHRVDTLNAVAGMSNRVVTSATTSPALTTTEIRRSTLVPRMACSSSRSPRTAANPNAAAAVVLTR